MTATLVSRLWGHAAYSAAKRVSLAWPSTRQTSTAASDSKEADPLTDGEQSIIRKLEHRFRGGKIAVQDVSGGCGTFYAVSVAHKDFSGMPTIRQHRMVNEVLADEIKDMHGIQLKTAPQ